MAKIDYPKTLYSIHRLPVTSELMVHTSLEAALDGKTERTEVAEYTLTRVVGAKMVADIQTEIG